MFKLSEGAKKLPGCGKVAIPLLNALVPAAPSVSCAESLSQLPWEGGLRLSPPSTSACPQSSGSTASWCSPPKWPLGFFSAACPLLSWLGSLQTQGSIWRPGECDKWGGRSGVVWKTLSLLWCVCMMSRTNISL